MPDLPYYQLAQQYGGQYGVDPRLVESVMEAESGGRPGATSPTGAEGLMQVEPGTGAGLARDVGIQHPNLYDPATNVRLGTYYLANLLRGFHGNRDEAIAGYNAGGGAVEHYHGIPPYKETQQYVKRVEENFRDLGGMIHEEQPMHLNWETIAPDTPKRIMSTVAPNGDATATFLHSTQEALKSAKPWESLRDLMTRMF